MNPLDKSILYQYIDACVLIKETEEEIRQIERQQKRIAQDIVKGSSHDFPYTVTNFHIEGVAYNEIQKPSALEEKKQLLEERKAAAEAIKIQVEKWLNTIPQRMQRIIKYKIFEGNSWNEVAARMGRNVTRESIRKEFEKFMRES